MIVFSQHMNIRQNNIKNTSFFRKNINSKVLGKISHITPNVISFGLVSVDNDEQRVNHGNVKQTKKCDI